MNLWVLALVSTVWATNAASENYRLPKDIKPEVYDLEIITYLCQNRYGFSGKVIIRVKCLEETNKLILHSKNLTIHKNKLFVEDVTNKKKFYTESIHFDEEKDFLIVTVSQNLVKNKKYNLFIVFEGILDDNLDGYYRSSYFNSTSNATEWMAVTQFEPTSARKAFPCFDEPEMKAVFQLKLGRPSDYCTISNMPLIKSEPLESHPGKVLDYYKETPIMSTYLLAFIVSKFIYKEADPTENGVTFRIYARKDMIEHTDFAKDVGPKALAFYEDYFDIKYVLPKQDMIAIPDFSAGAMENWGLITYRETLLLFDELINPDVSKYSIASVICHELAHQWFGNLVTMKWWTDLWLNEGFATQMAAVATDALYPDWNSLDYDTVENVLSVFLLDSLKTSHPISVSLENPKQINEIFDVISYKKGSFLLRMIINFIGQDTFKLGVSRYLRKHAYKNAEQDDLWAALTKNAHEDKSLDADLDIKQVMDTWTLQTGYPVLNVVRNYDENTTLVSQERFLFEAVGKNKTEQPCWWIPLTYMTQLNTTLGNTRPKQWLGCPPKALTIPNIAAQKEWILFNVNISALCRVNYDIPNWKLLIKTLGSDNFEKIPVLNRVQLIDDSGALAWTGRLSYDIHYKLLNYLDREEQFLPWRAAINNLDSVEKIFRRTSSFDTVQKFIKRLLARVYNKIGGYEKKLDLNILEQSRFQSVITLWACNYQVGNCISDSQMLYKQWQTDTSRNIVPKNLRSVNYCIVLKYGGEMEWNALWKQYRTSKTPAEQQLILIALGCTKDVWLLNRYLGWTISSTSGIRKQDVGIIFSTIANNEVGYSVMKSFLFEKLPEIYEYLGSSTRRISRVFMRIASQMFENRELDEFKAFTKKNEKMLKDSAQSISQAIETAQVQVEWFNKYNRTIIDILCKLNKKNDENEYNQ